MEFQRIFRVCVSVMTSQRGSSIMPQKRNAHAAELIRGKTARVYGGLHHLLTLTKGLPMAYNRDLQEDRHALFDAVNTTISSLRVMTGCIDSMQILQVPDFDRRFVTCD